METEDILKAIDSLEEQRLACIAEYDRLMAEPRQWLQRADSISKQIRQLRKQIIEKEQSK